MNKTIISANEGGIANRVFCLINSIYLAKKENLEVMLYWPEDNQKRFSLEFNDIFDYPIKIIKKPFPKNSIVYTNEKLLPNKKEIIDILKSLKWKWITKYKYHFGVHIRRGDFNKIGLSEVSPTFLFEEFIKRFAKSSYIATNDEELKAEFILKYGMNFRRGLKEDLEYLAKCKYMLCSYGSTFSQLAWYLGECKAERHVVIDHHALREWNKSKVKTNWQIIKRKVYDLLFR